MSDRKYKEAAAELNLPVSWLQRKAQARQIPHTRYGRHVRFTDEDIAAIRAKFREPEIVPVSRNVIAMKRKVA